MYMNKYPKVYKLVVKFTNVEKVYSYVVKLTNICKTWDLTTQRTEIYPSIRLNNYLCT